MSNIISIEALVAHGVKDLAWWLFVFSHQLDVFIVIAECNLYSFCSGSQLTYLITKILKLIIFSVRIFRNILMSLQTRRNMVPPSIKELLTEYDGKDPTLSLRSIEDHNLLRTYLTTALRTTNFSSTLVLAFGPKFLSASTSFQIGSGRHQYLRQVFSILPLLHPHLSLCKGPGARALVPGP